MPKEYYCNKDIGGGETCCESNPENFEPGRYSTCRKCRTRINNENRNERKKKIEEEKVSTKIQEIDPDVNGRFLIEETLINAPLFRRKTIIKAIEDIEQDITDVFDDCNKNINGVKDDVEIIKENYRIIKKDNDILKNEVKYLEKENLTLNEKIIDLTLEFKNILSKFQSIENKLS